MPADYSCTWCGGALYDMPMGSQTGKQPCPACLTIPLTEQLRVFARTCMGGVDIWRKTTHAKLGRRDYAHVPWWWAVGDKQKPMAKPVLPLWVPTAMDIAARVLASRRDLVVGATAPRWETVDDQAWVLTDAEGIEWWFAPDDMGTPEDPSCDVIVPKLATIPAIAPLLFQDARAMVLCEEATRLPGVA
jgi:hypothetical protein